MRNQLAMNNQTRSAVVLTILLLASANFSQAQQNASVQQSDSLANFREPFQKIASFSPDPCGPPPRIDQDSGDLESAIFKMTSDEVTRALNATLSVPKLPEERVAESLDTLKKLSAKINTAWPEENRFQFEILDLPPALVVRVAIRTHGRFLVFGIPEEDNIGKPNRVWRMVGSDDESDGGKVTELYLRLYPLHRGPGGAARFLAKYIQSGCAGSVGVSYDAREWVPAGSGSLEQIIKLSGAFGLDDKVHGFEQVGELRTEGSAISLPYCWFSAIDTWDNPSLCAVDTYDLSGNDVRFRARSYNRPDLLPIAKALEYAEQRDYPAVLAYCATAKVAKSLVQKVPPYISAEDLQVIRTGNWSERIEFGSKPAYRFEVARLNGRWLVTSFNPN